MKKTIEQLKLKDSPIFFICKEFFSPLELSKLTAYTIKKQHDFHAAQTLNNRYSSLGEIDIANRKAAVLSEIDEFSNLIIERIVSYLPSIFIRLGLKPFQFSKIQTQITASNDGDYFRLHTDDGHALCSDREISFVYYFNKEPKQFTGGNLILYHPTFKNQIPLARSAAKVIVPQQNMIVFFSSSTQHEITMVRCISKAFEDSRFTLNGWISK